MQDNQGFFLVSTILDQISKNFNIERADNFSKNK
jgi:hypothetical protein